MSDNNGSGVNVFLLGMIVGGVLGVMFAPEKGEETRKKVRANWKEWSKKALEMAEELGEEGMPRVEEALETFRPVVEEAAAVVEPIAEAANARLQPYVEKAHDVAERSIPVVKRELDEVADRARAELERRSQHSRPQFFKGV